MLDIYCAIAFAVILVGLAAGTRTGPAAIGRHLAAFPGTAFVAASTGAFVALGVWGLSLPWAAQPPLRLALYGTAWALLQVVLEAGHRPERFSAENSGPRHALPRGRAD